ncbi:MAG: ATP-binding protein [Patescibacteria group bacterium]|nr:ATP-binding protein [Patescibacteria group bacterium]
MIFMLSLGIFVLKNKKDLLGRLFFMISVVFAIWTFGTFMMFISTTDQQIIFWDRFIYLGVVFMPAFQYHFSLLITKYTKRRKNLLIVAYVLSGIFLILSRSNYFVDGVFRYRWGAHTEAGIFHHFFMAFFFFYIFALIFNIIVQFRGSLIKVERFKLALIAIGFVILNLVGGLGFLPAYKISIYSPVSLLAPLAFSIIIAYTILRYRFMDIRTAARRTFIYSFLTLYTFIFLIVFSWGLESSFVQASLRNIILIVIISSLLFTAGFYLLESLLLHIANKYLFAGLYNYQETIRHLSRKLTYYNDLDEIINLIVGTIKSTIRLNRAGVLLVKKFQKPVRFEIAKVVGFNEHNGISLVKDSFLTKYLEKTREPIVADELALLARDAKSAAERKNFQKLYENMFHIEASICLPLINEKKLIGIIVLGAKISGGAYTNEDLELLSVLANQAGIAINNARLYQQVKDFNQILRTKVDEQTKQLKNEAKELAEKNASLNKTLEVKNEFLRIVNHQLNTPVSIIKNSIFMMNNKSFDTEKGLSFINEGVKRIEGVLKDFWKAFAVEGEGIKLNLKRTDLLLMIEKLVADAGRLQAVNDKGLMIRILRKQKIPKVSTDPVQISQVISNLLDNAIAYTPNGVIIFSFDVSEKGFVKVMITDSGYGIDKKDRIGLFEKFHRGDKAKQYRPGGSGLGLYVARKIVQANGGDLKLDRSELNKGSTFSFTVPVWR